MLRFVFVRHCKHLESIKVMFMSLLFVALWIMLVNESDSKDFSESTFKLGFCGYFVL